MPKDAFDATPSWSGYTYQGKLALFHSLKFIVELIEKDPHVDLTDLSVELEWEEDFAIKKGDAYISLHQVKAYKVSSPSKYKSALQNLSPKLVANKNALGYLHVWKDIEYTDDIKDFESMKKAYNEGGVDSKTLDKISLYDYEGRKYCELEQVGAYIAKILEKYYKLKPVGAQAATSLQVDYASVALYDIIDRHVMYRHKNQNSPKQPKEIPFSDILGVIQVNYEEPSAEYVALKTKAFVLSMASKFCDNKTLCKNPSCEGDCGVKSILPEIEAMTPKELFLFLVHHTPDEPIEGKAVGMEEYRAICKDVGVKNSLFRAIYELPFNRYKNGIYINKEKVLYLPTTLHESDNAAEIAKNIIHNPSLNSIVSLYHFDKFISKDVHIEDLLYEAGGVRSWDPAVISKFFANDEEKIHQIKKIKILPIEKAKLEVQ